MNRKLALISLLFAGCSSNVTNSKTDQPAAEPTQVVSVANHPLSVADTGLYGAAFLDELQQTGADIRLWEDKLITGGDTILFPKPDSLSTYYATTKDTVYSLILHRINLTSMEYSYACRKGRNTLDSGSGIAMLNPGFYLGTETDEDADGTAYAIADYLSAQLSIRIAYEPDAKGRKRARINFGQKSELAMGNYPTLFTK